MGQLSEVQKSKPSLQFSDLYEWPSAFKAYPQLEKTPVEISGWTEGGAMGTRTGAATSQRIGSDLKPETIIKFGDLNWVGTTDVTPKTVGAHEASHVVQRIENFARGGSPHFELKRIQETNKAQITQYGERMDAINAELSQLAKAKMGDSPRYARDDARAVPAQCRGF